jgi:PAS domain S-box-containing protein
MLFETKADLILPLGVAAFVFAVLAIGAGVIALMNMLKSRDAQTALEQATRKIDNLERRMFHVLNAVPVALFETDSTGKFTFANKAAHMLVGRKDSELLGLRYHSATWGITYPDGRVIPSDLLPLARALRGQTVKGFQHLMAQPHTHDKMLVSVTSMPITNANGEIVGATSAVVELETQSGEGVGDITGLWRGQWFSAATVPFWGLDQDGTVLDLNPSAGEALGFEREALLGANWAQLMVAEEDFQTALDYLAQVQTPTEGAAVPAPVKIGLKDARGDLRPIILSAWKVATRDDKHEGLTLTAAPAYGLRALKAEDESTDSDVIKDLQRAEAARAALGVGAWFYDPQSDSIVEDAGMRALIGREFEGGPTLISDEDQGRADAAFVRLMSGQGQTLDIEIRVNHPQGSRWIALKGEARGSNGSREIFGVASDITAFKDAIEQESALRSAAFEKAALAEKAASEAREKAMAVVSGVAPAAPVSLLEKAEGLIGLTRMWVEDAGTLALKTLSPLWMTTTGLSAHEFLGDGWLDAVAEDDQNRLSADLQHLIETRSEGQISYRLKARQGSDTGVLILEYIKPVTHADGSFEGLLGLGFDISHLVPATPAPVAPVTPVAVAATPTPAESDAIYSWHAGPVIEETEAYLNLKAHAEQLATELEDARNAPPVVQEIVSEPAEVDVESTEAYQALQTEIAKLQGELAAARDVVIPEPEAVVMPDVEDFPEYQLLKGRAAALGAELEALKSLPEPEPAPVAAVEDFAEYQALKAEADQLATELEAARNVQVVAAKPEDLEEYRSLKLEAEALEAELTAAREAAATPPRPEDVPEYLTLKAHASALEAALDDARTALEDAPRPDTLDQLEAMTARAEALEAQLNIRLSDEQALRQRLSRLESMNGALEQSEAARQTLEARAAGLNAHIQNLLQQQSLLEARSSRLDEALAMAQRFETVGRLTGNVANDFNQMLNVINNSLDLIRQQAHNPDNILRLSEAALAAGRRGERLTRQLQAFTQQDEVIG